MYIYIYGHCPYGASWVFTRCTCYTVQRTVYVVRVSTINIMKVFYIDCVNAHTCIYVCIYVYNHTLSIATHILMAMALLILYYV